MVGKFEGKRRRGQQRMRWLESITDSVVMNLSELWAFALLLYRCESWTIKKAECQRTDAFKLCCWRRL